MEYEFFGKLVREAREKADITKTDLAQNLGFSLTHVIFLEQKRRKPPSIETVHKIADKLNADEELRKKLLRAAVKERVPEAEREIIESEVAEKIRVSEKVALKIVPSSEPTISKELIKVPLLKAAPHHQENWTQEEIETWYKLSSNLIKSDKTYFLCVKGDSMIEAGIKDGNKVIVDFQRQPNNGDIVVAWLNGGKYDLRKFYDYGNVIVLRPANPKYEEETYTKINIKLRGIVIGVFYI